MTEKQRRKSDCSLHRVGSLPIGRFDEMGEVVTLLIALIIIGVSLFIYKQFLALPSDLPTGTPVTGTNVGPLSSTATAKPPTGSAEADATAKPASADTTGSTESGDENGTSGSDVNVSAGEGKKKKKKKKKHSKRSHASKDGEKKKKKKKKKKSKSKREKKPKKEKDEGEKAEKAAE
ncbi:unnamed protein product [Toxocara canis]|uniref:Transmembrane protein n=1 Tax=Toxocara canis TaxID=6265 RepID=A0A183UJN9_TOXCA|nr:unnamed protein product [Toxocara canis]